MLTKLSSLPNTDSFKALGGSLPSSVSNKSFSSSVDRIMKGDDAMTKLFNNTGLESALSMANKAAAQQSAMASAVAKNLSAFNAVSTVSKLGK